MAHTDDLRTTLANKSPASLIQAAREASAPWLGNTGPADTALFEPRMADRRGHFALLADQYLTLAEENGMPGIVFHHQNWSGERRPDWYGLFPISDHLAGADVQSDPGVVETYTDFFYQVLIDTLATVDASVAIFPTARFLTLPAITRAISERPTVRSAIIGIMETWPVPDCEDGDLVKQAFRQAAHTLSNARKDVLIIAESEAIADWLLAMGFRQESVQTAPYPAAARFAEHSPIPAGADTPRFHSLGALRPVQNPGLLAKYLLSTPQLGRAWSVRLNHELAAQHLGRSPTAVKAALETRGVTLLPTHLNQPHYDHALTSADAMLLPYGDRYRTIGSGIFLECVCAGVIPLVPGNSTMRALYESLGGTAPAIKTTTVDGLAAAVDECAERLPQLKAQTAEIRDAWLNHPHGPRQWRRRVSTLMRLALGN